MIFKSILFYHCFWALILKVCRELLMGSIHTLSPKGFSILLVQFHQLIRFSFSSSWDSSCVDSTIWFDLIIMVLIHLHVFQLISHEPMHWLWTPKDINLWKKYESISDVFIKFMHNLWKEWFFDIGYLRWRLK